MTINKSLIENSNHKVVVVLDRNAKFAETTGEPITITCKDEQGRISTGSLSKSKWTASIDATIEYFRVVRDLFVDGLKQIRIVTSEFGPSKSPIWLKKLVTHKELISLLNGYEVPSPNNESSILTGLSSAIEALSEKTHYQQIAIEKYHQNSEKRNLTAKNDLGKFLRKNQEAKNEIMEKAMWIGKKHPFKNNGTIVLFTSIDSKSEFDSINAFISEQIDARNRSVRSLEDDQNFLVIDHVEIFMVNILGQKQNDIYFPNFSNEFISTRFINANGKNLIMDTTHKILLEVYDLVSTTISGIPMKEETQLGQSVNYDVELLHLREAHSELLALNFLAKDSRILTHKADYDTVKLKWCTLGSKFKTDKFPPLMNTFYLTPAYVHSRPTCCLTTFVLNGKSVMLEVERDLVTQVSAQTIGPNMNNKLISHYLSRGETNGSLLIQSIALRSEVSRNNESQPEIAFNKNDVNLPALTQFIQNSMLTAFPQKNVEIGELLENNSEKLKKNIQNLAKNLRISLNEPEKPKEEAVGDVIKPPLLPPPIQIVQQPQQPQQLPQKIRMTVKRPLTEPRSNVDSPKGSRSNSPTAKRIRKKYGPAWLPGEKINLKEYFEEIYERNLKRKTKEFVGFEKFGDKAQTNLYPDLKIPEHRKGARVGGGGTE